MSRNRQTSRSRDIDMEYAAHPWKPSVGMEMIERQNLLYLPRSRPPVLAPEPVDVSRAIGRPPLEWEAYLIIEARQQERARELVLFRGVPGGGDEDAG